ncbi:hypothetical protein [Humisphaera borealis]|uniref:Uncharacterized protein n=1 Tax=Humisphaera borealis TaxID=2807512 RepID=A0A7M2X2T7_9BACT|nr:hypothetical protein [Humisphaera borealis]QOV92087.1 hypothetical protein IPV69_12330 [Humisphaera borealis]
MAKFTTWLTNEYRGHPGLALPPEVAEELNKSAFNRACAIRKKLVTAGFGVPDAEELVQEQVLKLLEILDDPERQLTLFVKDTPTLLVWMLCEIRSRFHRRFIGPGHRNEHGLSATRQQPDGGYSPLGMQDFGDQQHNRYRIGLEEVSVELAEAMALGLGDMTRWRGSQWAGYFGRVYAEGHTQAEIVLQTEGVSEAAMSRGLMQTRFCVARRLGWTTAELEAEFGTENARNWTRELDKLS